MANLPHTKNVRIGADEYRISRPDAVTGARTAFRLLKIIGPGLPDIFKSQQSQSLDDLFGGIWKIIEGVDEDTFVTLLMDTVNACEVRTKTGYEPVIFEHHFALDLAGAIQLAKEALAFQYGNFISLANSPEATKEVKAPFRPTA